ncbi:MAG: MFS transporter [Burkholderiales bacterium]
MPLSIYSLAIGVFAICTSEFVIMGLLQNVAHEFQVSISFAGFLVSGYALGVVLGAPLLTPFLLALPRKEVLIGLMFLFTLGNLCCALAPNYGFLLIGRFITALAQATFFGLGAVVAAQLVTADRQASAVSAMFMGATIANVVGAPIGTAIGQAYGWRMTFFDITVLGVLAAFMLIQLFPKINAANSDKLGQEFHALMQPALLRALLITVLGFSGAFTVFTYIAPILTKITGVSANTVPVFLLLFGLGLTVGNPIGGRLSDHNLIGAIRITLIFMISTLLLMRLLLHSPIAMSVIIFLFGVATFATITPLQLQVMAEAGKAPVLASAFNIAAFNLGNAGGAWIGGVVISHGFGITAVPWIAAAISFVGLALTFTIRKPTRRLRAAEE